MEVSGYKCINCDGTLVFDSGSGKLKCEYCGSEFEPEVLDEYAAAHDENADNEIKWNDRPKEEDFNSEEVNLYTCSTCGAEIITDSNTAATQCPYCGNVTFISDRLEGMLKPDLVIPFKVDKNEAIAKMKEFCSGKPLLPKGFLDDSKIQEIKGMYVPFWMYDAAADAHIVYDGEIVETHHRGKDEIIHTHHYMLVRDGGLAFDKIPVDGSSKIDNTYMEAIEPFDYSELVPFSTTYLAGYLADKYDEDYETCKPRANERITNSTYEQFAQTVAAYTSTRVTSSNINLTDGNINYSFMPVWMVTAKWKDQQQMYIVNGQTGKLVGNLPVSKGRVAAYLFGIAAVIAVVLNLIIQIFFL